MGKKSSAPDPDERIGEAALMSAEIGGDYLEFMKGQAAVTNEWADSDRARYKSVFEPLQDDFIQEAQGYDTPEARNEAVRAAQADVSQAISTTNATTARNNARMGIDPRSGRSQAGQAAASVGQGLAMAGAANSARKQVESEGRSLRANAVNLGSGFAVNPATSMGLANSATSAGFSGAMQGQNQKGSMLNTQFNQQMSSYQADQASSSSLWGGIGSVAGLGLSMLSTKEAKENNKPARGVLDALKRMPVDEWDYKKGAGDEGRHIGTYAEDFQKATGKGDGKSIPVVDAIGVTMGAIKELSDKVDKLEKPRAKSRGVIAS